MKRDPLATAFGRVCAGYVEPAERTLEGAEKLWCRIAAQGRIVGRAHDQGSEPYRVHLTLIAHPAIDPRMVYAVFGMGQGSLNVYLCLPEDARDALLHPSAFNL